MNAQKTIGLFVLLLVYTGSLYAQKNDTLVLLNNDRISGEIKKLEYGVLTYKTDDMGTLSIDWKKIKSLKSNKTFEVIMSNGMIYYAEFDTTHQEGKIRLIMQMAPNKVFNDVERLRVVRITQIKGIFWSRFSGGISFGTGIQKANSLRKLSLSGNTTYRDRKYLSDFSFRIDRSKIGEEGSLSTNQNANLSVFRQISGKWFAGLSVSAEQNTEQGLDLRALLAANIGSQIIRTNRHNLLLIGGVQGTREWSADSLQTNHLEGKLRVQYKMFNFQHPKVNFSTAADAFPGLTDWGRIRTNVEIEASIEIFKDFIFGISIYHKFDNRPATQGASSSDWSFDTSIGYTF